jgi:hypothetical protein
MHIISQFLPHFFEDSLIRNRLKRYWNLPYVIKTICVNIVKAIHILLLSNSVT